MKRFPWPFAQHIAALVLASAVPSAAVAAALATYLYHPGWQSALALSMSVILLMFGAGVSFVLARDLDRMLDDLATDAQLMARDLPLTRLQPVVREAAAIADALADAASHRAEAAASWRWDLVTGTMRWNIAAETVLGLDGETVPSLARLYGLVAMGDRGRLTAWLASLARGERSGPCEFRVVTGGEPRHIRAEARLRRESDGTLTLVAGSFADAGATEPSLSDAA
jgi:PAS domain-containing protein